MNHWLLKSEPSVYGWDDLVRDEGTRWDGVRNAQAAAHLRAHGVRVLSEEPRRGTAGSLVVFAHPKDCGGVLVELVQPARAPDGTDVGV